jgi:thiamine kinase-like enzyme
MQAAMEALAAKPVMSPAEALDLVSRFFDKEWPDTKAEDVIVTRLTGGAVNQMVTVKRTTASTKEPSIVLVRQYDLTADRSAEPGSMNLTRSEETLLTYEMSRRGWGPHLYGIFPAGRVEEYVLSHPLTADEAVDPLIRRDVARAYARFASLRLPFAKRKVDKYMDRLVPHFQDLVSRKEEVISKILAIDHPDSKTAADLCFDTDWSEETKWVKSLFTKYNCKPALTHYDSNLMNILVKEEEADCKTMLIDYETAMYGYRGLDIGNHLAERMFRWTHPEDQVTGKPFASKDERIAFCREYLDEVHALGHVLGEDDTVQQLLLEAEIGTLFFVIRNLEFMIEWVEPASIRATKIIIELYHEAKARLISSSS